jgi:hypothetical protein
LYGLAVLGHTSLETTCSHQWFGSGVSFEFANWLLLLETRVVMNYDDDDDAVHQPNSIIVSAASTAGSSAATQY